MKLSQLTTSGFKYLVLIFICRILNWRRRLSRERGIGWIICKIFSLKNRSMTMQKVFNSRETISEEIDRDPISEKKLYQSHCFDLSRTPEFPDKFHTPNPLPARSVRPLWSCHLLRRRMNCSQSSHRRKRSWGRGQKRFPRRMKRTERIQQFRQF